MKRSVLLLLLVLLFPLTSGFSQVDINIPNIVLVNPVPFKSEFIKYIEKLDFYISRPQIDLTMKPPIKEDVFSGILVRDAGLTKTIFTILNTEKGKYAEGGEGFMVVRFRDNIDLKFIWNSTYDIFVLEPPNESKYFYEGASPYLIIYSSGNGDTLRSSGTFQAVPVTQTNVQVPDARQTGAQASAARLSGENEIIGKSRSGPEGIVSYIQSKNRTISVQTIRSVVNTYIEEASREGVRHDVAIAQMCYATDYLADKPRVTTHNYAGLLDSKFPDRTTGIRAHIQHLKSYASTEGLKTRNVDPRYNGLRDRGLLGRATTLDQLYRFWAPQNYGNYGNRINAIIRDLR